MLDAENRLGLPTEGTRWIAAFVERGRRVRCVCMMCSFGEGASGWEACEPEWNAWFVQDMAASHLRAVHGLDSATASKTARNVLSGFGQEPFLAGSDGEELVELLSAEWAKALRVLGLPKSLELPLRGPMVPWVLSADARTRSAWRRRLAWHGVPSTTVWLQSGPVLVAGETTFRLVRELRAFGRFLRLVKPRWGVLTGEELLELGSVAAEADHWLGAVITAVAQAVFVFDRKAFVWHWGALMGTKAKLAELWERERWAQRAAFLAERARARVIELGRGGRADRGALAQLAEIGDLAQRMTWRRVTREEFLDLARQFGVVDRKARG